MINIDWQQIRNTLAKRIPKAKFNAWVQPIHATVDGNILNITVPSRFFLDGLQEFYGKLLQDIVTDAYGAGLVQLRYAINADLRLPAQQATEKAQAATPSTVDGNLDMRLTFKNFVVGSSNEFSHAACLAVADSPGHTYNPLYIYGGVGLGKTHLINAIGNILVKKSGFKLAYRTSEHFTNELVSAIRSGTTLQFRDRYRQIDVLVIDDVQFIAGKGSTQEEMFHTFNALYDSGKQIIFTSDRTPHEINNLEERLKSRFSWGLVADIQPPSLETRMAILECKIELAGIVLPQDVIYLLAARITSNVRELEGALTRLTAHASLTGKKITASFAREVLREQLREHMQAVNTNDIQKRVAAYYNTRVQDMHSPIRARNVSFPRQIAMYACKQLTSLSLPEIGNSFGGRDHTTVLHAVRKIEKMMMEKPEFNNEIQQLLESLR
ncbi:MAG: chromosomal replication initiator protein DnaA [Mariprofundales bacterium]